MAYELKNGQGNIFKNANKTDAKHPDYRGTIKTPGGEAFDLSLWVKDAKDGKKYFSVSVQPPYQKESRASVPAEASFVDEQSDSLPF